MSVSVGGGAVLPYFVYHKDKNIKTYLRIAQEIYLKKLVVGGFGRVFEIGKQFRNDRENKTTHVLSYQCDSER